MTHTHKEDWYAMPVAIIIAGALIASGLYFGLRSSEAPQNAAKPSFGQPFSGDLAAVGPTDHIRGSASAKAIIVEYSDTECPFCKRFHMTMKQIMAKYGAKNDVAWVYRHFPIDQLHAKARRQAEATECAAELGGNDGFWAYIDRLFEITPSNDGLADSELPNIAQYAGIDRSAFISCLSSGRHAEKVQAQFETGVRAGVNGTPLSFIVTKKGTTAINGAVPFEELDRIVSELIK